MDRKHKHHTVEETLDNQTDEHTSTEKPAMVTEIVEEVPAVDEKVTDFVSHPEPVKKVEPETTKPVEIQITEKPIDDLIITDNLKDLDEEPVAKSKAVVEELFNKPGAGVTEISIQKQNPAKPLFWWALIVIIAALTTGIGLIVLSQKSNSSVSLNIQKPTPTIAPTNAPVPTAAPTIDRSQISIDVLNGGGVSGAASKMKTVLTDKGYKVGHTGNTSAYTYDSTEISVKPGKDDLGSQLKTDLTGTYTIGNMDTKLATNSAYDAKVIVGKN